jgi:hypothetical protein
MQGSATFSIIIQEIQVFLTKKERKKERNEGKEKKEKEKKEKRNQSVTLK